MDRDTKYLLRRIVIDILCLFTVGFPILLFYYFGKPFERGFYCDDESLKYPFKPSTVTSPMLYLVGMFLPITSFVVTEFIHYRQSNGQVARTFYGRAIPPWIWSSYKTIGVFGFGVACSHLTTDIAKYVIGRLRPHFFAVCVPNINCTEPKYMHKYIEEFTCTGDHPELFKEVRLSFPSGHSSFSAYTMIYLVLYLQARMTWKGSKLLKHFCQYICLLIAVGTALSRVSDYKHHWSDVLAGFLQGAVFAVSVVLFISDLFPVKHNPALPVPDMDTDPPSHTDSSIARSHRD
ncbi:putative phosphatidate phosphatase isoform X1 [Schistocerca cancellata]|uniref:putative phosphatidate phosphatase isoform X1 n=1 Tax=Schistocerca cancellata TaxID=274614 RepID=UPI0021183DD2|nr:putative phosphatidate phosphatase isoform X1 [Schistocerca cancellata]